MVYYGLLVQGTTMRSHRESERVLLGQWSQQDLDRMLAAAHRIVSVGQRIEFLSAQFLGTPYRGSTLIGDANTPELFTINLEAVDCFTYLDYVEAMRRSDGFISFKEMVRMVRYRGGKVGYKTRNHFFTDWIEVHSWLNDVTAKIGGEKSRTVHKRLNDRGDGTYLLAGIGLKERDVTYIPGEAIDSDTMRRLKTGDYIGIYSRARGLDVSHVGIVIKEKETIYFRHASSLESQRKVINQDFRAYVDGKPGIVVLRPVT
ncbi:MAG: N-acetylmuramoyl-L-alanine amidase-like domain-containing protein [Syntrophorhabdales bacterium]